MANIRMTFDADTARAVEGYLKLIGVEKRLEAQTYGATRAARRQTTALENLGRRATRSMGTLSRSVFSLHGALAGLGIGLLARDFVLTGASMEKTRIMMGNLFQDMDKGRQAVAWVMDFSTQAPMKLDALLSTFVKLRTAGLDPTAGSMQTLVDAISAYGGSSEELKRASVAIQQMAGKGVISMEELRQQLGEVIPDAIKLMAGELGVELPALYKMIKDGALDSTTGLEALFQGLEKAHGGKAKRLMEGAIGLQTRLSTEYTRFKAEVMNVYGGMDAYNSLLKGLIETIEELKTEGSLEAWAKMTAWYLQDLTSGVKGLAMALDDVFNVTMSARIRDAQEEFNKWHKELERIQKTGVAKHWAQFWLPSPAEKAQVETYLKHWRDELNKLNRHQQDLRTRRGKRAAPAPLGLGPQKTTPKTDTRAAEKAREIVGRSDAPFPAYMQRQLEWDIEGVRRVSPEEWGRIWAKKAGAGKPQRVEPWEWEQQWKNKFFDEQQKQLEQIQQRVHEIRGSFIDFPDAIQAGMGGALSQLMTEIGGLHDITTRTFTSIGQTIRQTAGEALFDLVTGTFSWQETVEQLSKNVLRSLSQMVVDILAQRILMATVGKSILAAELAAMAPFATGAAAMWSPAAVAASIATMGAASATGLTAFEGSLITGKLSAVASALVPLAEGGLITRPTPALIGEAGPELVIPLDRLGAQPQMVVHNHIYDFSNSTILDGPSLEAYVKSKALEAVHEDYAVDGPTRNLIRKGY